MSGVSGDEYRLSDYQSLPLGELQTLYQSAITELLDLKVEFEEFQSKTLFMLFLRANNSPMRKAKSNLNSSYFEVNSN